MKAQRTIKIITIILLIAIISIASFMGIYQLKDYKVKNVIPEYLLGMEFENSRIINFMVDKTVESTTIYDKDGKEIKAEDGKEYKEADGYKTVENKVNPDDILTKENYKKTKSILSNRLVNLGAKQYIIKQDENNGNIQIIMSEDNNTDRIISNLIQKGTFELKDTETNEVLLDTSNIKSVRTVYGQAETGETTVYLQINFNKEGQTKLEEISKIYVETTTQTTNEDGETEDETQTKEVSINLNEEEIRTTYFGETITDGNLNIAIGSSSDSETLQDYILTASEMEVILNSGILPITYDIDNYVVNNEMNGTKINTFINIGIALIALMIIYSIIKLKAKAILAILLNIGYVALLLLTLRYTDTIIATEGIVGIVLSVLLNYIYINKAFANLKINFIKETTVQYGLKLIPIYIIAIIFTFNSMVNISSLGMTLVWGIIIMYLYNLTLTQITIKTVEEGKNVKQ